MVQIGRVASVGLFCAAITACSPGDTNSHSSGDCTPGSPPDCDTTGSTTDTGSTTTDSTTTTDTETPTTTDTETGSTTTPPPNGGEHQWSKRFGDVDQQFGHAIAVDSAGAVFVTGHYFGTMDFGTGVLWAGGTSGAFLAKLDATGEAEWARSFGTSSTLGHDVAVSGSGDVVLTGTFSGSVDFGGAVLDGDYESFFVAKLDSAGNHLWSLTPGDEVEPFAHAVAIEDNGNVVIGGSLRGTLNFGGGPLDSVSNYDVFVAKLDAFGSHLWSKRFGDDDKSQFLYQLAVDGSGNVLVLGSFAGTLDLGGVPLQAGASGFDTFLAKLDDAGNHLWSRRLDGGPTYHLAVDASGAVILAGTFVDPVDFGGGPLSSAGGSDIFVARLDPSGGHVWSERFGDSKAQGVTNVTIAAQGRLVLVGSFGGTLDFGGGALAALEQDSKSMFLAKLDGDGDALWSRAFAANLPAGSLSGLATGADGSVLTTGDFYGTVDFGGGPLQAEPTPLIPGLFGPDVFVAKHGP